MTAAERLLRRTQRLLPRWSDARDAEAAGFSSIGDAVSGYEHLVRWDWLDDGRVLDPRRPESLVYEVRGTRRVLVSAMYVLPPGTPLRDAPALGDARVGWHDHDNLCWDKDRRRVAGVVVAGRCVPGGTRAETPPMLHVWLRPHPCGPFAGIDGHGSRCGQDH